MEEDEKVILTHQFEEWKYLNEYVNKMDTGYQQTFVVFITLFTGVVAFVTKNIKSNISYLIFLIPLGMIVMLAYVSYQFRITAILRGHLAALEDSMNEAIHKKVHLWNSVLVETFMAHNNSINKYMMIPMMFLVVAVAIYCMVVTALILKEKFCCWLILWIMYWILITALTWLVLYPFLKNESIRAATYNEEEVIEMYNQYTKKKSKSFKYE